MSLADDINQLLPNFGFQGGDKTADSVRTGAARYNAILKRISVETEITGVEVTAAGTLLVSFAGGNTFEAPFVIPQSGLKWVDNFGNQRTVSIVNNVLTVS